LLEKKIVKKGGVNAKGKKKKVKTGLGGGGGGVHMAAFLPVDIYVKTEEVLTA